MKFAVLQFINIASSHTSGHHRDKSGFAFFLTLFLPSGIHMYMRSFWAFSSPGWSNPALSASLHMRNVPAQKWTQQPRPGLTSVIFVNYRELSLHLWINYYVSIHQFSKRVGKSRHRITGTYKKMSKRRQEKVIYSIFFLWGRNFSTHIIPDMQLSRIFFPKPSNEGIYTDISGNWL